MEKGGHEPRNAIASRSWESPSADSQPGNQDLVLQSQELNSANSADEQEMDSPLDPPGGNAVFRHLGFSPVRPMVVF